MDNYITQPYEALRDPRLPWGYWMVIDEFGDPLNPIIDEDGRRWQSLRAALWYGRLGMGDAEHPWYLEENAEFLLAVLATLHRTAPSIHETVLDLFDGQWRNTSHYAEWLLGRGLIIPNRSVSGLALLEDAELTPEGRAVLMLLLATRPFELAAKPIGMVNFTKFAEQHPEENPAALESAIAKAEAALPIMDKRFVRHTIGQRPAIVMIGNADAKLLKRETKWSITFDGPYERNLLYAWMLHRVDRWEDWITFTERNSPRALTELLLMLRFAHEPEVALK